MKLTDEATKYLENLENVWMDPSSDLPGLENLFYDFQDNFTKSKKNGGEGWATGPEETIVTEVIVLFICRHWYMV